MTDAEERAALLARADLAAAIERATADLALGEEPAGFAAALAAGAPPEPDPAPPKAAPDPAPGPVP